MRENTGAPILQDILSQENISLLFELTLQRENPSGFRHGMNMVNQILRLVAIEQAEADAEVRSFLILLLPYFLASFFLYFLFFSLLTYLLAYLLAYLLIYLLMYLLSCYSIFFLFCCWPYLSVVIIASRHSFGDVVTCCANCREESAKVI
jgi:hypothetical protein